MAPVRRRRCLASQAFPSGWLCAGLAVAFGRTLHVLVRTRSERGFVRLYDAFDAHELLEGSHVLVGGVLDEEFDGVELVTDVEDRHRPLLCASRLAGAPAEPLDRRVRASSAQWGPRG